jgi:hypothetical protein
MTFFREKKESGVSRRSRPTGRLKLKIHSRLRGERVENQYWYLNPDDYHLTKFLRDFASLCEKKMFV